MQPLENVEQRTAAQVFTRHLALIAKDIQAWADLDLAPLSISPIRQGLENNFKPILSRDFGTDSDELEQLEPHN